MLLAFAANAHVPAGEIVAFGFDFSRDGRQLIFAHRTQTRDVVLLKNLK